MFYPQYNQSTQTYTIYYKQSLPTGYGQGKEFSSFTYTTLGAAASSSKWTSRRARERFAQAAGMPSSRPKKR